MASERILQLKKFLKEDPNDPFLIYALATEYNNIDKNIAKEHFDSLLKNHPDYVATYYHAAALYSELGFVDKAKEIYETGLEKALKAGDKHAHKELSNAYQNFLFEEDL
ncbi:hypothetical protein FUAX_15490 [Fulvitalea axinellae]|uniref:Tetratricopeptide repeat protein n=1 Tax=Fulvitalea axinellae TaxID=1182444 RepID=A0AAU9CMI9_9BACT|nr:hypothetical protein FUAX_15490 [Fulvitalea axinellae]